MRVTMAARRPIPLLASVAFLTGLGALQAGTSADLVARFQRRCRELIPQAIQGTTEMTVGEGNWLLLTTELQYAAAGPFWGPAAVGQHPGVPPDAADPVRAIAEFRADLARSGIELLFVPAPTRIVVCPEAVLGAEAQTRRGAWPRLQPAEVGFFKALDRAGVPALDLTRTFLKERDSGRGPLYVASDPHWTGAGAAIAALEIGRWVKRRPWFRNLPTRPAHVEWKSTEYAGPIFREWNDKLKREPRDPEKVQFRVVRSVTAGGATAKILPRNPESPVILIGDSHTLWWRSHEASLYQNLASELGFPVDVLSTVGGGANQSRLNLVRQARSTPGYLDGKRLVIWCFASRSLLGPSEGWLRTPLDGAATEVSVREPPPAG